MKDIESGAKKHVALVTAMAGTGESLERFLTGEYRNETSLEY